MARLSRLMCNKVCVAVYVFSCLGKFHCGTISARRLGALINLHVRCVSRILTRKQNRARVDRYSILVAGGNTQRRGDLNAYSTCGFVARYDIPVARTRSLSQRDPRVSNGRRSSSSTPVRSPLHGRSIV